MSLTRLLAPPFVVILFSGCAVDDPVHPPHTEAYWRHRIAQVHRGMSRAQVDKLLPPRSAPDESRTVPGGVASEYALDSAWRVAVPYDSHGFPGFDEEKNPYGVLHLYENRVIGDLQLIRQPTTIDWKTHPE